MADNDGRPPSGLDFRGLFLTYMVLAGFLAVLFLLYFNRALASLISFMLRQWTWRRYGIYIDIQAIQVSLLGGRIFFVGFRYHGNNETILIQNGHITWAYWLRRVRHVHIKKSKKGKNGKNGKNEKNGSDKNICCDDNGCDVHGQGKHKTPCRINVTLSGLEWFVYNRSAAYDSIVQGLSEPKDGGSPGDEAETGASREGGKDATEKGQAGDSDPKDAGNPSTQETAGEATTGSTECHHVTRESDDDDALSILLQLLPIHLTCDKAAMVMGNENTSAILTVKAQSLTGEIDAVATETPDPYRQVFRFWFKKPVIQMRDNDDYREDQAGRAMRDKQIAKESQPLVRRSLFHHYRRAVSSELRNLLPYFRRSVESFSSSNTGTIPSMSPFAHIPGSGHWQGLSRYLDGPDGDEKTRWNATEYAMLNPILESPRASLTIYWDAVGTVTAEAHAAGPDSGSSDSGGGSARKEEGAETEAQPNQPRHRHNINGHEPPPAWGMALSVGGGNINYGPWADRKRAELQRVFFPSLCKDALPAENLPVGAPRTPTEFKLFVELDEEVTLRVPVREASKNWRFKDTEINTKFRPARDKRRARSRFKKAEPVGAPPSKRPYGWLDIKIAANATVSFSMDMAAGPTGYSSKLDLDLPKAEISSSANQQVLWRSAKQTIACDLSTPLKWNGLRQWHFQISSHDLELFLLRDHIFLLTDLIDDWGTGPPSPYLVFTPFKYFINLRFPHVKLYLNVNDANIINNPTNLDDNTFIIISSPLLESALCIPLDTYRPPGNAIPFSVRAGAASIGLHVPSWNTQSAFVAKKDMGALQDLLVDGTYHYCATSAASNTDSLVLNVSGREPVFTAHGFILRYFLKLKDNYFGDDMHFKTLEEYQDNLRLKAEDPEAELSNRPPHKVSNDLDVILNVRADNPRILLPANLYSASRHVQLTAACLTADLRFTNYFMDLDLVLSPLSLSAGFAEDYILEDVDLSMKNTQMFIDGVHVFGNRLFGLPPSEPTYLCNWDVSVGAVTGDSTAGFLLMLANGGRSFGFTFDDEENALIAYSSILMFDVTFLRASVQSVDLWIHLDDARFLLSLPEGVHVNSNDWARSHYSKRADVSIPDLQLSCINADAAVHGKLTPQVPVETYAFLKTGLAISVIGRKFEFSNERRLQQELVRREDQRTHRTGFLLLPPLLDPHFVPDPIDPPAQAVPSVPQPITVADIEQDRASLSTKNSAQSSTAARSRRPLRHQKSQSSFLSASSVSQSSVVRPESSLRSAAKSKYSAQGFQDPRSHLSPMGQRDFSSSTRQSGFFSAAGEYHAQDHHADHPLPETLASKFFMPYFPLNNVRPDTREAEAAAAALKLEEEDRQGRASTRPGSAGKDSFGSDSRWDPDVPVAFELDDVDPEMLSEDRLHSSILVEVRDGMSAFMNPKAAKHIALLLSSLQPRHPEDILDTAQIESVDEILGAIKHKKMKGKIADIAVRLPRASLRLLNSSSLDAPHPLQEEQDQYDLSVSRVTFMSRAKTSWGGSLHPGETTTKNSFQLKVGSIGLSASERLSGMAESQAAFTAVISDVLVSFGSRDLTYLDTDIGAVEAQLSSEKIGYMASLAHRTGVLASYLTDSFDGLLTYSDHVRTHLARRLIESGVGVADPGLLTRPSAVLRSANQHIRTDDSWKLAVRFRQLWTQASASWKMTLLHDCRGCHCFEPCIQPHEFLPPPHSVRDIVDSLKMWRGWDMDDISHAVFLKKLFGETPSEFKPQKADSRSDAPPFMAVIRLQRLQMVLDPGPKQNEIQFLDLTVRFEDNAPPSTALSPLIVPTRQTTASSGKAASKPAASQPAAAVVSLLNVYCADSIVHFNWEICELVEDILVLYKNRMQEHVPTQTADDHSSPTASSSGQKAVTDTKQATPFLISGLGNRTVHVVCALDHGAVFVDTVNLNICWSGEALNFSLLLRQQLLEQTLNVDYMMSGRSISSCYKSHSEMLLCTRLREPSGMISYEAKPARKGSATASAGTSPPPVMAHSVRATASSRDFALDVKQDPVVFLELLDLLVMDEVAQLNRLKAQLNESQQARESKTPEPNANVAGSSSSKLGEQKKKEQSTQTQLRRPSLFQFKIALFLDHYTISMPLLRSLTYKISGVVARVAVATDVGKELTFDFDIKENAHDIQIMAHNKPRSISLLQIPPTNGRITTLRSDVEQTITVFSSLELVQLDASAVYSLLSALNRPEISNTMTEMQQQLKGIKSHMAEILDADGPLASSAPSPQPSTTTAKPPNRRLIYSVHSTFAGLEIFGNSPLKSDVASQARLSFCLDSVRLEASNRIDNRGPVLPYPELYINLGRIAFEILKGTENSMASCGSIVFAARITATSKPVDGREEKQFICIKSDGFDVSLSPETVSTVMDVLGYMGNKIKDLDTTREMEYLRKLRQSRPRIAINDQEQPEEEDEEADDEEVDKDEQHEKEPKEPRESKEEQADEPDIISTFLSSIAYTFEIKNIQINWLCALAGFEATASPAPTLSPGSSKQSASLAHGREDLVLLLERIELGTRSKNSARLTIENFQLQMVPPNQNKRVRSAISALLPEVIFSVGYGSTRNTRRLAFQAIGKALDLRLSSESIVPVSHLKNSIELSMQNVRQASLQWTPASVPSTAEPEPKPSPEPTPEPAQTSFTSTTTPSSKLPSRTRIGSKRLESLLVDMDFAGAVVYISGKKAGSFGLDHDGPADTAGNSPRSGHTGHTRRPSVAGKYGQFSTDEFGGSSTMLRSPGLVWKMKYQDTGQEDPTLHAEVRVDASSNVLYPSVVPLVMDMTASIKEVFSNSDKQQEEALDEETDEADEQQQQQQQEKSQEESLGSSSSPRKLKQEESILMSAANPQTVLGRLRLNLGLRVCKQQFSLSCQPIARVAATTGFDDLYLTINTVRSDEQDNFVAISANLCGLQASVQHVYSRESMGTFQVESMVLSLMNSKRVSGVNGISAMLKVSPMKVAINARQLQDFLLFREIWTPRDLHKNSTTPVVPEPSKPRSPSPDTVSVSSFSASASVAGSGSGSLQNPNHHHQPQYHLVQRYQQVAATAAFPWTATLAITALEIHVDLGQALGRPVFAIEDLWMSSKKTSDWEQNLCLGIRKVGITSTGRLSGFVTLDDLRLRTSIEWPAREQALNATPLVQASLHFSQMRTKVSFDYQAFLVADITELAFLMYNVRRSHASSRERGDRLVAIFDCDAVQVFGTATSAAQGVALYQAILRLVQERKSNFESSLREIERFTRRRSSAASMATLLTTAAVAEMNSRISGGGGGSGSGSKRPAGEPQGGSDAGGSPSLKGTRTGGAGGGSSVDFMTKSPISLDTDVVVTLKALNLGVFPGTFTDQQVFKMEATNAQARFAANIEDKRIHSNLGLTLGQLRVGLAGVRYVAMMAEGGGGEGDDEKSSIGGDGGSGEKVPKTVTDLTVEDVVLSATGSRGGTILKVPRFEAGMQTWQRPESRQIDYIFKSALEGKVEVGWNYSRISYIRGMWANHSRTLEQTWGRELPLTAIRLTGMLDGDKGKSSAATPAAAAAAATTAATTATATKKDEEQPKITAEVNVPQSKYEYHALEPAVIETPQLRDMGEATPPLEWIGLNRDRLPNLTHQIVIVSLLELAGEVEDAYSRILGST